MPIGSQQPDSPELLDSKEMRQLLLLIKNSGAEIVIFDAPSLLNTADACVLGSKVDATLIVTDITTADKKTLTQVNTLVSQTFLHVLGCVINKQPSHVKNTLKPSTPGTEHSSENRNYNLPSKIEIIPQKSQVR